MTTALSHPLVRTWWRHDLSAPIDPRELGVTRRTRPNHLSRQPIDLRERGRGCRVPAYDGGLTSLVFAVRLHDAVSKRDRIQRDSRSKGRTNGH